MFSIPHFTLVNIIPKQEIIQELVASRFTKENIAH
jgi:lipid A disaccharide synthetase